MKLSEYFKKRDFKKTAEPRGKVKKSEDELHFVVQKHDASHLHYDFRLEIEGVLVSWAVPKGPSRDTSIRRLAMQTEDHPMDYIGFEGTIPKGQYGGGTVMVWDTGTFLAEGYDNAKDSNKVLKKQLKEGSIKVVLKGKKLKGSWHLVRLHGKEKEWLLIKGKDEYADPKATFDENSVLTKRTMDQIEHEDDEEESENEKEEPEGKRKRKSSRTVRKETATSEPDDDVPEFSFSAEDVQMAKKISAFPSEWRPQLATLTDKVFDHEDWIFENKYDGYRVLVQINNQKVNLISRNGISFNHKYPEILNEFANVQDDMILDGEIVVEDKKGKSRFQWLQDYDINSEGTLKCYLFDILYFGGFDLRSVPLIKRKEILYALAPWSDRLIYSEHVIAKGKSALKTAEKKDSEGIIAKRANSHYLTDKRSKDWLKIKLSKEQEMVIGGYTDPQGSRKGFGSLLLGYYENGKLMYAGKVGTGFNEKRIADIMKLLVRISRKKSPFKNQPKERNVHWVNPELIAQIRYSEWTEANSLRHPVFIALRNDKKPEEVKKEVPMKKPV